MHKYWDSSATREFVGGDTAADRSVRPTRLFPPTSRSATLRSRPRRARTYGGVTDTVFRRFIKNLGGCGLIMTEFTSADGVLRDQRVRGRYLHFYEDEHPISAQLFGSDPECSVKRRGWSKTSVSI